MAWTTQQRAWMRAGLVVGFLSSVMAGAGASGEQSRGLVEGNLFTVGHRESAGGQLRACGIEFGAIKRDFATRQGDPVFVAGSFYVQLMDAKTLGYALKIGAFDHDRIDRGVAPAQAFVRTPSGAPLATSSRVGGDNPAYAIFVGRFGAEVTAVLNHMAEHRTLEVGFNRQPGQADLVVDLDLTVIDVTVEKGKVRRQTSDVPVNNFLACVKDLKLPTGR